MLNKCIVTGNPITPENDSEAHVFPSALGGRLKPKGIVCRSGNGTLDKKFDAKLIAEFNQIMVLLGGSRDRGKIGAQRIKASDGLEYYERFGEPLALQKPVVRRTELSAGIIKTEIQAQNKKQANAILESEQRKFDKEIFQFSSISNEERTDYVRAPRRIDFDPSVILPAAFAMAGIYAASNGVRHHPRFKNYVEGFSTENPIHPPDTFFWMPKPDPIVRPETVSHVVIMRCDGKQKIAFIYIEIFNTVGIGVEMPYVGLDNWFSYGVDIISGKSFDVIFDKDLFDAMVRSKEIRKQRPERDLLVDRMRRIAQFGHERQLAAAIKRVYEEELAGVTWKFDSCLKKAHDRIEELYKRRLPAIAFSQLFVPIPTVSPP